MELERRAGSDDSAAQLAQAVRGYPPAETHAAGATRVSRSVELMGSMYRGCTHTRRTVVSVAALTAYAGESDQDLSLNEVSNRTTLTYISFSLSPLVFQGDTVTIVGQDPQTGWWRGTVDFQTYGLVPINFLDVSAERLRAISLHAKTPTGEASTPVDSAVPATPTNNVAEGATLG